MGVTSGSYLSSCVWCILVPFPVALCHFKLRAQIRGSYLGAQVGVGSL